MPDTPPQRYVAYPRGVVAPYGTSERLQAVADAYKGLTNAFFVSAIVSIFSIVLSTQGRSEFAWAAYALGSVAMAVVAARQIHTLGKGKAWGRWTVGFSVVFMTLNFLICGVFGFIFFLSVASSELTRYKVAQKFVGVNEKVLEERLEELRLYEAGVLPAVPAPIFDTPTP